MPHSDELDAGNVLAVENLNIAFMQDQQKIAAVRNLSFSLQRGETLAIVGESGSGKSVTALALMRLLEQAGGLVQCDKMLLQRRSREVIELSEQNAAQMRHVRGADMAMIFQEPMTSLNPVFTVGEQIAESIRLHQNASREEAMVEAKRMLDQVRIPEAQTILSRYPHQLSGGMRQRVMIAMALSCRPAVLIADEPTTALDVTIQAQILQLIKVLQKEMSMGVIFITHDMGVVAEIADRVLVMYQGEAVETGTVEQIFHAPQHPYTRALLAAVPQLGAMKGLDYPRRFPLISLEHPAKQAPPIEQKTVVDGEPVLRVRNLVTRFPLRSGLLNRVTREVHAVEKVSFDLWPGETLSLVGESGSGKSTTGRALLRLVESQGGEIIFNGQRIDTLSPGKLQALRRDIQFIFQDPYASLIVIFLGCASAFLGIVIERTPFLKFAETPVSSMSFGRVKLLLKEERQRSLRRYCGFSSASEPPSSFFSASCSSVSAFFSSAEEIVKTLSLSSMATSFSSLPGRSISKTYESFVSVTSTFGTKIFDVVP